MGRTNRETPAGKTNSEIHQPKARPQKSKNPPKQQAEATTLAGCKGVAAPSFSAGTLGEQCFDLLQLSLEHALDVMALVVDLGGDLSLQGGDLRVRSLG